MDFLSCPGKVIQEITKSGAATSALRTAVFHLKKTKCEDYFEIILKSNAESATSMKQFRILVEKLFKN
jgi:hypothetical protein